MNKDLRKKIGVLLPICLCFMFLSPLHAEEEPSIDYGALSKMLGHLIVKELHQPGFAFDLEKVIEGMREEQKGLAPPMSQEEYEQIVVSIQEELFAQAAEKNLSQATQFLEQNAKEEGVHAVDTQLHYRIVQEGTGAAVAEESTPLIHYKGQLINGTVFASSAQAGQPVALPIKQSIPGFAKGLVGMQEGEKRILYIHPELAYGLSSQLPPNSLLIFEVEIVKAEAIERVMDEAAS